MGGLILGILALIAMVWILIVADSNDSGALGLCLVLAIFAAITITAAIVGNGPEYASSVVKTEKAVPVAGYYISNSGEYVTESGEFERMDMGDTEGGLPADALTRAPIVITIETKHKKNFWHLKNKILTKKVLRFDNHDE